jgi:competence protein ComEA
MTIPRAEQMALLALGCALLAGAFVVGRGNRAPQPVAVSTPAGVAQIRVHVVGEVTWPGQYLLKPGARVQDAILAAHGPTVIADLNRVNLAAPVRDGDRVVVPRVVQPPYPFALPPQGHQGREHAASGSHVGGSSSLSLDRARRTEPAEGGGTRGSTPSLAVPTQAGDAKPMVNVNTATTADLESLPGIGPVLARRIVEHREAKGLYRRLDDLLQVKGIGPKLLRRLQPWLRLDDGT